jgi:hypothetical protein
MNDFAKEVTLMEGLKKQVSIAQVKEIMKIIFTELAKMELSEVEKILKKYRRVK